MELNLAANNVRGLAFGENEKEQAASMYADEELAHRGDPKIAVVMVSAKSVQALRRAYPSFFTDLNEFPKLVEETIE